MKNYLALILCLLTYLTGAQNSDFRPVRARDFNKTALSGEFDCDAVVLFRKHYSYFSPDHQDFSIIFIPAKTIKSSRNFKQ